jgi:hypothetical protein
MNYFISAYQSASRWKKSIVVVVLLVPVLIGGGNLVKQMPQFADTGHCSSYSLDHNSTQSCTRMTSTSQTLSFTNNDLKGDSFGLDARKISLLKKWFRSRPTQSTRTVGSRTTHFPPGTADLAVNPKKGTAPTSTPPPSIPPGQGSVAAMISQIFGPYASGALNVAKCESGLNPNSYNPTSIGGSHAEGVFQILYPSTWMGTSQASRSPYDAQANILAAHEIFVRDGYSWREWSCAP